MRKIMPCFPFLQEKDMTLNEIITTVNELKPNQFEDELMLEWLNTVEGKAMNEVFCMREADERIEQLNYKKYDKRTEMGRELLIPEPYTDLYKYYLFAMIDLTNEETDRYTNSMLMFNNSWQEFTNYWYRTHKTVLPQRFKA